MSSSEIERIDGVYTFRSNFERDARGSLSAFAFRETSPRSMDQLNIVKSKNNVLRGMHVHSAYDEFYIPVEGHMYFALMDARRKSPTFGVRVEFAVNASDLIGFRVPVGVAHGALFLGDGMLVYGISKVWDGTGEFGCRWDDPDLGFNWPIQNPILSERDSSASSYADLVETLNRTL